MKKKTGEEIRYCLDKSISTPMKLTKLSPRIMKKIEEEKVKSLKRGRKP
jgi:hypothetical protein